MLAVAPDFTVSSDARVMQLSSSSATAKSRLSLNKGIASANDADREDGIDKVTLGFEGMSTCGASVG